MTFLATFPSQTEAAFMAEVIKLARLLGWAVWHDNATNTPRRCADCGAVRRTPRNESGWPDLVMTRRPRIIFAELKSDRGKVTDAQRAWLLELRACGQEAYVWKPKNWRTVETILRQGSV